MRHARLLGLALVFAFVVVVGAEPAFGATQYGITTTKGCASPTKVGQPYTCSYTVRNQNNNPNDAKDTVTFDSVVDTVQAASPPPPEDVFSEVSWVIGPYLGGFSTAPSCAGGTGDGSAGNPFRSTPGNPLLECTLPFGSELDSQPFSFYTVQPADYNVPTQTSLSVTANPGDTNVKVSAINGLQPGQVITIEPFGANPETRTVNFVGSSGIGGTGIGFATPLQFTHLSTNATQRRVDEFIHRLSDSAQVNWHDLCDNTPDPTCSTDQPSVGAASSTVVELLQSATSTVIHNAAHQPLLPARVVAGSTVHDFVVVSGEPGSPAPTGNVTVDWFLNGTCTGAPAATSAPIALAADGTVDATGFPFTVNTAGQRAFLAHYPGDGVYAGSDGSCEPLTVVDANIQLTPATATNPVNTNHTLHCHVSVNDGSGETNAPDGTSCTVSIVSGPGGPTSQNCTTVGATGSCDVVITSTMTGTSTLRASTDVTVGGLSLHRETGDANLGDGPNASKLWVDARITISANGVNEINHAHTFTVLVEQNTGSGFEPAFGVDISSALSGVGSITGGSCGPTGTTDAAGTCTVTVNSPTPGVAHVNASGTVHFSGGVDVAVSTSGYGAHDIANQKTWVDANIQITPATATNPVSTNHTLHCHININTGTGGYVNAPSGTTCTVKVLAGGVGGPATQNCTTAGATGSCDVVITSATPGTSTIQATTTVDVSGVSLTRTTGDTNVGDGPNASKLWADDAVVTHVRDAGGQDVTGQSVTGGTVVHDEATVAKAAGTPASVPAPTGTVTFTLYSSSNCTGTVVATDANKALNASGLASSATFTTPSSGSFSYRAHYNGDANYPAQDASCEPFSIEAPPSAPALTPGFWKNHEAATTALLPITLGTYNVNTFSKARAVFDAMKCSSPIDCLAGHLLAAKLDLKSGSDPSITPTIAQADALLAAVHYAGPGNFTTPTSAQKTQALQLEVLIDNYTNA